MNDTHKNVVAMIAMVIFLLFCLAVGYFIGVPMVQMAENPAEFQALIDSYGVGGRLIFVGIVVLQVLVAFIPGEPIELAAGYVFGFWEGTLLTLAGFLIGSWLVFALVRRFGVKLVEVFFPQKKLEEIKFLQNPRKARALSLILMVIPGTPKDMLSYFAGLTKLTTLQWLAIVAVGRIPSLVTSTLTGAAAGEQHYLLSGIMLAVMLAIGLAGVLYYRHICKQEKAISE